MRHETHPQHGGGHCGAVPPILPLRLPPAWGAALRGGRGGPTAPLPCDGLWWPPPTETARRGRLSQGNDPPTAPSQTPLGPHRDPGPSHTRQVPSHKERPHALPLTPPDHQQESPAGWPRHAAAGGGASAPSRGLPAALHPPLPSSFTRLRPGNRPARALRASWSGAARRSLRCRSPLARAREQPLPPPARGLPANPRRDQHRSCPRSAPAPPPPARPREL